MNPQPWLIYGANGYTGRLIAEEAVRRGWRAVVAGRRRRAIERLAAELGCDCRVFSLSDPQATAEQLRGFRAVLNCAGPFSATGEPMMDACLRARVHYLDITGEIAVIEAAAARHEEARRVGVSLIPAVGFDVVPTDCLAVKLSQRLPGATRLQLAMTGLGRMSPGTMRTLMEVLAADGWERSGGELVRVPIGAKTLEVPFPGGRQTAVSIPTGDLVTAWHSTGIENIEVYATLVGVKPQQLRRGRLVFRLLRSRPLRAMLGMLIRRGVKGPSSQHRAAGRMALWGRAADEAGHAIEATLETPEAYRLTVETALGATQRVLDGPAPPGFLTPAQAFGADFVLELPETDLRWSDPT